MEGSIFTALAEAGAHTSAAASSGVEGYIFTALAGIFGIVLLFVGMRGLRRKRLIENVPTSKVEGVFLGLTEVKGRAEPNGAPLVTYLAETAAVYYAFKVEEHWRRTETYTDSKGNTRTRTVTGWTTVRSGEVRRPFFLRDDTGRLRVDPDKAEVDADTIFDRTCGVWDPLYYGKGPRYAVAHSTYRRRFTEQAIVPGKDLYVMGNAKLREDVVEPEIRYDAEDEMFLISTSSEDKLVRRYHWQAVLSLGFGWVLAIAAPVIFAASVGGLELGAAVTAALLPDVAITVLYWAVVFALYLQLVYNGLIDVKNRLQRAWSLIDVQLKRRHDLVPNLVAAVKRYAAHESDLQQGLADTRAEAVGAAGGVGGALPDAALASAFTTAIDGQTLALGKLFGVAERYPPLHADEGFRKLQEELARTERKIALARSFYNESVTSYNNRLMTMPDVLVARPLGLKQGAYLHAAEFEKAVVEVRFDAEPEPPPAALDFAGESVPEGAHVPTDEELEAAKAAPRDGAGDGGEG